jgi:ATP/maltotriose-dependent transcriptional regulator MalT
MSPTTSMPQRSATDLTPRFVERPRLMARLCDGARAPLTVITAPAGYGKSVLLGQWAACRHAGRIALVTLRAGDDGPGPRAGLVAAVRQLGARVDPAWARRGDGAPPLDEPFLDGVAAALEPVRRGVLVLDSFDAPGDPAVAEAVGTLPSRLPGGVHVVVAQRSRWPSSQGHLDPRGEHVRLDEADLAFTFEEARELIRHVAGRDLSRRQLEALLERTEGWPVGLWLAATALRGPVGVEALIETFAGCERDLDGYVHDEVLGGLPAPLRRFLVRTSVLDRPSGPLCDEVTGEPGGERMLRLAEERGLVTRRVGAAGDACFRYHPLVRDVLRRDLRQEGPAREAALLARAAAWHLSREERDPAYRYLVEAGDPARLLEMIDRCGRSMFERGEADEVLRWLDAVPGSNGPHRPDLAIRRAYLHTMIGNKSLADQVVQAVDRAALTPGEAVVLDALEATWAFFGGSAQSALRAADAVLAALDDIDPATLPDIFGLTTPASLRMMAGGSRARALWHLGEVDASRRAFTTLAHQHDAYPPWRVRVHGSLGLLEAWAGNFQVALDHARHALAIAATTHLLDHPASSDARLAVAHVARERGDLRQADIMLTATHAVATRARRPVTLDVCSIERALWHLAAGRPERGRSELERTMASGDPPPPPLLAARRRATEVRLLVALGDIERARAVLDDATPAERATSELAAVSVQLAVARHDVGSAASLLGRWCPDGVEPRARLERELWAAVLDAEADEGREARRRAGPLLTEARAEGHVRLFLDAGPPVEHLLRDLHHASPTPYLRQLLRAAQATQRAVADDGRGGLSERELEVVRYLPTPLSNAEIAARLFVSVNTVKTHIRAIYRKLGVTGRREAIQRAEDLGIA